MSTRPLRHLAQQHGYLRDEGLTVRLRSFRSTDATTTALRDGVVPVTIGWRSYRHGFRRQKMNYQGQEDDIEDI
jgi:hypothetical protein